MNDPRERWGAVVGGDMLARQMGCFMLVMGALLIALLVWDAFANHWWAAL